MGRCPRAGPRPRRRSHAQSIRRGLPFQPGAHGRDGAHQRRLPGAHARHVDPPQHAGPLVGLSLHLGLRFHRSGAGGTRSRPRAGQPQRLHHRARHERTRPSSTTAAPSPRSSTSSRSCGTARNPATCWRTSIHGCSSITALWPDAWAARPRAPSNPICIRTWDYFYNSGGWDDYPPQVYVHRERPGSRGDAGDQHVAGHPHGQDHAHGGAGAGRRTDSPSTTTTSRCSPQRSHTYAWDEDAGYFSYVLHDADGHPVDILRHESRRELQHGAWTARRR